MTASPPTVQELKKSLAVSTELLRPSLAKIACKGTQGVPSLKGTIGQPRAMDAIHFGIGIRTTGFNMFVAGPEGSGRESTILDCLKEAALSRPVSSDWAYIYNFEDAIRPIAVSLSAGKGAELARDMEEFLDTARREIPQIYDSEDYDERKSQAVSQFHEKKNQTIQELVSFAIERSIALRATPAGFLSVPVIDGKTISDEDFEKLPKEKKAEFEKKMEEVQVKIRSTLRQARHIEKQERERVRELDRDVAQFAIGPLLDDLREKYQDNPVLQKYFDQVQKDVPGHLQDFRPVVPAEGEYLPLQLQRIERDEDLARYRVNVLVSNGHSTGAPVVVERNPTYYNLLGRINYRPVFHAMLTNLHDITPGSFHRANGGYLVMRALDVLRNPFSWQALKRALMDREIQIENLGEQYSLFPTVALRPQPIPWNVKVVLIGSSMLYHLLYEVDDDFRTLFKVKAEFSPEMEFTDEAVEKYIEFISRCVQEQGLRHFDASAVAHVLEYGSWLREDQRKLSTKLLEISDVVAEASHWAEKSKHELVSSDDVRAAIRKKEYRSSLLEERVRELISNGTLMIDSDGFKVGQINGISVRDIGDHAWGQPARITASVGPGRGKVLSIERETDLSGPIHSKGVLILSGFLANKYAQRIPLALSAAITFEQSYDEIEGDSASSSELYCLLSALSGLPINQGVAVTGSVNQKGEVQAVGGVTKKIEGFFIVCKARGLTGRQGVVIPVANIPNLTLCDEVIDAVSSGKFHIWAVRTVDEGISLLMDREAGELLKPA